MIRRNVNGYEHYECSRCGEETHQDEDYCQVCGHSFDSVQNETLLEDSTNEDETICVVDGIQKSGLFTFTLLKKDITPKMLLNLSSFQGQRMMAEPNPYEFYVFKPDKYPYLSQGTQVNLNLDLYDSFRTSNGFTIYFDKRHFTKYDINVLKTYNFNN